MLSENVFTFDQRDIAVIVFQGEPFFRASDVTNAIGYADSAQAIRKNVAKEHVRTQFELGALWQSAKSPLYISFLGAMEFTQSGKAPKMKLFKEWILMEVIPVLIRTSDLNDHIVSLHYRAQMEARLNIFEFAAPIEEEIVEGDALYVMTNTLIPNMVKIGRSIDPNNRAKDLSKSQPFHIVVCGRYDGYGFLEKVLHHKLIKRCVVGGRGREWFSIEPYQARLLIEAAILEHHLQQ
jgi:prophage antirepressor-like protein